MSPLVAPQRLDAQERSPILKVTNLRVEVGSGRRRAVAVAGVSFSIFPGETLGLVGESGCGKSTTARAIVQLQEIASGSVLLDGVELTALGRSALRDLRRKVQIIFQDPISSLNPRRLVKQIVAEPLDIWRIGSKEDREHTVIDSLNAVGLDPETTANRRPGEFSGGQCQRISIARALAMNPDLLVCDEIVSALDVSVQAQILNLLEDLKSRFNLTMLFIAHDLAVVKSISDRIAVMYLGKICEIGPADDICRQPSHPYTNALMTSAAAPSPRSSRASTPLPGEPPSLLSPPSGCRFSTRCPMVQDLCHVEEPQLHECGHEQLVACHFPIVRDRS